MTVKHSLIALSVLMLAACKTTVIDDEDRKVPDVRSADIEVNLGGGTVEGSGEAEVRPAVLMADMSQSFIAFTGSRPPISHEGAFKEYDFTLTRDVDGNPDSIEVTIDMTSMYTDSDGATNHLMRDDFFAVETYPQATFISQSIVQKEGDTYEVTGDLTIRGTTKTIIFLAEITDAYMLASFDLNRMDYGVGAEPGTPKAVDVTVPMEVKIVFK